jgi:hypothetical protein
MDANVNQKGELTPYEEWQLEKYGNIVPCASVIPDARVFENGFDDINRFAEWMTSMAMHQNMKEECI